ncbi:hypothetical protein CL1_1003 [Thermococcus cleftensis]|uniref:Uncharacterized protein n=1 Tax=Thermococcus cleftensis (strain DSM 27260 / KACC 17922 / CL1) TaxID=163003 RepID=I3ZU22_THECF|nr:hypothetical protein [Thermococcus cleftensis]AFL95206.1 hypothetical protein CL1_1003 [Thermococcus cleftensis]
MEEVRELKSVLERVEGKLIAAGKLYGAMSFAVWLAVMLLYYVIIGVFDLPWQFNIVYWPVAFILAMGFTGRIWRRLQKLGMATGKEVESSTTGGILIAVSWITGIALGWGVIPRLDPGVNAEASLAVGFLSFITLSVFGMWLVFAKYSGVEREIIPSFLIPALGIALAAKMESGAMVWAGFLVALGFSLSVLLYIYSAFKAIER